MSGFEIVGVVFAVLPPIIEVGKRYAQPVHRTISPADRDEKLLDFYRSFWWETWELQRHLQDLIEKLPNLTEDRKAQIVTSQDLDGWSNNSDVVQAMTEFFLEHEHEAFQTTMSKVLALFAKLIKDDTLHISKLERNQLGIYHKLQAFQADQRSGAYSSHFWERVKF